MFSPEPAASCICVICHDILKDASSLKECGHTFCEECINQSLTKNPSCPSCRAAVTGVNPAYIVRQIVDEMQVRCPEWEVHEGRAQCRSGNKRKRSENDGNCIVAAGCNWKGPLKELHAHASVCDFKVVTCGVIGCNHTCKRKDMEGHLSGAGMLLHVDLIRTGYEKRMEDISQSIRTDFEKQMKVMETYIMEKYEAKMMDMQNQMLH